MSRRQDSNPKADYDEPDGPRLVGKVTSQPDQRLSCISLFVLFMTPLCTSNACVFKFVRLHNFKPRSSVPSLP